MVVATTRFECGDDNKVTWRNSSTDPTQDVADGGFEQIDYVLINNEFQYAIKDAKAYKTFASTQTIPHYSCSTMSIPEAEATPQETANAIQ